MTNKYISNNGRSQILLAMSSKITKRQERRLNWWKAHKSKPSDETETGTASGSGSRKDAFRTEDSRGEQDMPFPKRKRNSAATKEESVRQRKRSQLGLEETNEDAQIQQPGQKRKITQKEIKADSSGEDTSKLRDIGLAESETKAIGQTTKKKKNKKRYILFVGNLPYNATQDDIENHFSHAGCIVTGVRLLTDKTTGKSRGIAYVDLEDLPSHKRALRQHKAMLKGRSINVEFTSAGRKTDRRNEKLKQKNRALAKFKIPRGKRR